MGTSVLIQLTQEFEALSGVDGLAVLTLAILGGFHIEISH
jgi:hypothetical protein